MINLDTKDSVLIRTFIEDHNYVQAGARVIALVELGWTRKEIANSLGVSPVTLRNWANAAKTTGVHAIFDDLTPKSSILSRVSNYSNHTIIRSKRAFSSSQSHFLSTLHTSTKRTRSWVEFKDLISFLIYLRYPISHIAKALDTSNSHVSTLISPLSSPPTLFSEFQDHAFPLTPSQDPHYYLIQFPDQRSHISLTKLLPKNQILFTIPDLSNLIPLIHASPMPPLTPSTATSDIIELDTPYLISQTDAIHYWGIVNEKDVL